MPPEDTAKRATEFKTVMDGLAVAKAKTIPVDERELLDEYGIPVVSEERQRAMEAEAKKKAQEAADNAAPPSGTNDNALPQENQ
jgi:hypothetical protein